ncbi:MAG TPA: protein-disulfide reductase DsbD family protein [Ottowia sp.]|uniref:protein-disulfide reductase DsbD family protein n=1 Tax=Ottowia sp. TaxID=1898956 RepID=UPI002B95B28C|nr:thioredoxin family protein [Ottowia sp.]HMN21330.1 protein-disulfide reductase DsbD family protein [Ottowia sp.]
MNVLAHLLLRVVALFLLAMGALPLAAGAQGVAQSQMQTDQVRAVLLAWAPASVPTGEAVPDATAQVWVGLQLTHQPDWHTYWKNSGDSGLPTELHWTLPPGVLAGDVAWPLPSKIFIGDLANYGYEGTVLLPVPLTITPEYQPGPLADSLDIGLKASWLVCRQECIPQEGEFALKLPLRGSTALHGAVFQAALASQPAALDGVQQVRLQQDGQRVQVRVSGLPPEARGETLELFPETPNVLLTGARLADAPTPRSWTQAWDGDVWVADVPVSTDRADSPRRMPLVLTAGTRGWRAEAEVEGEWPALAPLPGMSPALEAALQANAAAAAPSVRADRTQVPAATFALALLGALVGGAILNLMPCVFPILAIKVLGFTRHGGDRRAHRASGLAYSAGVVLSFVLLGALMLALRAAGEQLGWGFQLQSPAVVAALAALFTVIGLNLAGVFEFGQFLPSGVAALEARHPTVNAALSGVLAVAVASPCTAPFMGASLGLAVGLPALQALALFAVLGLGMALPYLAASWLPAVARALPRPGAWMDTFKKFMAFPMFGTAVWLLWVLGQQSGIDGAAALLALLVLLAFVLWALGLGGRARWWVGGVAAALALLLLPGLAPRVVTPLGGAISAVTAAPGERWQPWSAGRVQALLADGKPVFVDFTAAWCVTCQYNKKTTLGDEAVLAAFDAAGVQTLRADWTRRDAAISAELQRLGRSGVPVYVLQAPGQAPIVLSEILSVGEVRNALARL